MQTWETSEVPEKWKAGPQSIKNLMPHWQYNLLTARDRIRFVKKFFPDFLDTFRKFEYTIQKADAIRYMWLYVHGGLYMDLRIVLLHPLDELFQDGGKVLLVRSSNFFTTTNSIMASKPRVSMWLECLREMKKPLPWWCIGKHLKVMNSTGPVMLDRVVKSIGFPITYLPSKLINPCSVCEVPCTKDGAYVKLLEGSSWVGWDTKLYLLFLCHWRKIVIGVVILIVVLMLIMFLRRRRLQRVQC